MIHNICSLTELIRALERNRLKIEVVEDKLDLGYLNVKDLEELTMFCNRVSFLSQELIGQRNLEILPQPRQKKRILVYNRGNNIQETDAQQL